MDLPAILRCSRHARHSAAPLKKKERGFKETLAGEQCTVKAFFLFGPYQYR